MMLGGQGAARGLFLIAAATAITMFAVTEGRAQSSGCRDLTTEPNRLSSGSNPQVRHFERAIAKQQASLNAVEERIRKADCGFGIVSGRTVQCAKLRRSAAQLKTEIARLRTQRRRAGGGNATRAGARIRAAMQTGNCDSAPAERSAAHASQRTPPTPASSTRRSGPAYPGKTYRTLCVRTCDGYYFPISFSVEKDKFERDAETCQARCPGTEVALYAHDATTEMSEDMVSVESETPYSELPNAFSYRRDRETPSACRCKPQRNFAIIAGETDAAADAKTGPAGAREEPSSFYRPSPRPDPATDGETRANRRGGPDRAATGRPQREKRTTRETGERRVRVVGPAFLPDPEEAIDLRAPDRTNAR